MKKISLQIISVCISLSIYAQPFAVGHMSINFKDVNRTNAGYTISGGITTNTATGRAIGTEVYYPAAVAGNNVALASGQFPVVVFGHGFVMTYDAYDNIYNRLASLGYIVLMPRTEGSFSPTHSEFGADLKYLANAGMALNTISTSTTLALFNGKVLQKSAIGGHSMGAGSSFLAAASNNTVTCLFNMCAATTNPSSLSSATLVTVPSLLISGEMDSVADTTVQNSHYTANASLTKFHVITTGAKHCDFGNGTSGTCTIGQPACTGTGCNAILFARYMSYLEPFLAYELKNDCSAGNTFMSLIQNPSTDRAGRKIKGSIACVTTGLQSQSADIQFSVFPNPTEGKLIISYIAEATIPVVFELYDISGRLVLSENADASTTLKELSMNALGSGSYILYLRQAELKKACKIIKY
ncbi:MAG: T9SS type A sorting domain-containing protein [Bacteroidota bacterium]